MKEQVKTPKKINNERQINNQPDREFKTLVIKMLTELEKRIDLNTDHFNKELENIKKTLSKIDNSISEIQCTLEEMTQKNEKVI